MGFKLLSFGRTKKSKTEYAGPQFEDVITGDRYTLSPQRPIASHVMIVRQDGQSFNVSRGDFTKSVQRKHLVYVERP